MAATRDLGASLLEIDALEAWYGQSQVLRGLSLGVQPGEVVALVGRNGVGKTTTLKSVMGLIRKRRGSVRFGQSELIKREAFEIARAGIGYVPEGRVIFRKLTVRENIEIALNAGSEFDVGGLFELFPRLQERQRNWGYQLSGGEQQMLAIARALATGPKLILLDEPSQGLAPVIVDEVIRLVRRLKKDGVAALIVEQNIRMCLAVADQFYILDQGTIVYQGDRDDFESADDVKRRYLTLEVAPERRTTS